MNIDRAVITAAGPGQRHLPLQTLIDRDGEQKSILTIVLDEVARAGVSEICVVVHPGDETAFRSVAGDHAGHLRFIQQKEPLGYGHAVWCAREFTAGEPFLHLIGDHLFVSRNAKGCTERVVETARAQSCAVSAVQPTRESLLPHFGAVSGKRVHGRSDLFVIDRVAEKPTPTEAEQRLLVPGLRAGMYLCFFGIHVLTPAVMEILDGEVRDHPEHRCSTISGALQELSRKEKYLALEMNDHRYNVGEKYGLLSAQLAVALNGRDRLDVMAMLVEMLLQRESAGEGTRA
jgi:UTP--glucose-1-phosphate uridylyltransferase